MEKVQKMSRLLRDNCCETCRNIPQKTLMKDVAIKRILYQERCFFGTSAATSYK